VYKSAADVVLIFVYISAARLGDALTEANMNVYSMLFQEKPRGDKWDSGTSGTRGTRDNRDE